MGTSWPSEVVGSKFPSSSLQAPVYSRSSSQASQLMASKHLGPPNLKTRARALSRKPT